MQFTSTPISKLEKLCYGLELLRKFQPAAFMSTTNEYLIVGDATDSNLPNGLRAKLREFEFGVTQDGKQFGFNVSTGV